MMSDVASISEDDEKSSRKRLKKEKKKKRKKDKKDHDDNERKRAKKAKKDKKREGKRNKVSSDEDEADLLSSCRKKLRTEQSVKIPDNNESVNVDTLPPSNTRKDASTEASRAKGQPKEEFNRHNPRPMVESSSRVEDGPAPKKDHTVTLVLFYQYVEPPWNEEEYQHALKKAEELATHHNLTGRMRVAREGFNCTLTASQGRDQMFAFLQGLRDWKAVFYQTEFKLTHDLPPAQAFPQLKVIPVVELVHYGLEGRKAPPIAQYSGTHLEPQDYHQKLAEPNTVVIDVRNHYEAMIGHFDPPKESSEGKDPPPKYLDPKMRKSTEFPAWLDHPDTQKELKGKQVLMFCTGGIRCERASALLKYKMATDKNVQDLGIKGVYQLQGGVDKYFKEFPTGGYWKGKNYVFDKRFSHAPLLKEDHVAKLAPDAPLSKCESCNKPWDKFRGKKRCPTCGVPSLICKDCLENKKIKVRCALCVEQDIHSKRELRAREQQEIEEYERRSQAKGVLLAASHAENPDGVTRLFLKNMDRRNMTEDILLDFLPDVTHLVWRHDRGGQFTGQAWVEMRSPQAAAAAVARTGTVVLKRALHIKYDPPNGKDVWPPPRSAVSK